MCTPGTAREANFVLIYSKAYKRQGTVVQGTLVRIHLCEFDYEVVVYEIWVISNKLIKRHKSMIVTIQSEMTLAS
jgi:hypothetical protein